eukprot:CAMPEP_0119325752 /NCGR_PEP_ID=MMETSP1333-20130426/66638_1 /TAXON_ID=418940 /ORGANISM="Scyphosphaera apsteinii, Strain RCC1455" /LENGTH=292 /DNA_ID=CAMNT_0007333839 /DNA_START=69 /DNA_END=944 /DNA_ORIENTATION=-
MTPSGIAHNQIGSMTLQIGSNITVQEFQEVAHFHELNRSAYKEWAPIVRRGGVCVVSMYTPELLLQGAWGRYAMEINLNWARLHGYKFTVFQQRLIRPAWSLPWSLPRSALFMLEQGQRECEWVFSMDGDAAVNNATSSVEDLIEQYFTGTPTQLLISCHWHVGEHGNCHTCRCNRAKPRTGTHCSEKQMLFEYGRNGHCAANMGVYLVKNTPEGRELMRWWVGAGDGACNLRGDKKIEVENGLGAQKCLLYMKAKWPELVDVVNARVMNMPAWFNEKVHGKRTIKLEPQPW